MPEYGLIPNWDCTTDALARYRPSGVLLTCRRSGRVWPCRVKVPAMIPPPPPSGSNCVALNVASGKRSVWSCLRAVEAI